MRLIRRIRNLPADPVLCVLLLLLCGAGLAVLHSAADADLTVLYQQGIRLLLAWLVLLLVACIPLAVLTRMAPGLYVLSAALLLAVLLFGEEINGARRWLQLGWFHFQPAELVKLSVPMMLAWYYSDQDVPLHFGRLLWGCVLLFLPVSLIVPQPDLGTALLVATGGMAVIFVAGVPWWQLFSLAGLALAYAPLHWLFVMHDYQRARVVTFLNPGGDPLGSGYHIIQSQIAIGSGGLTGKGWLSGTQSHLQFLPERSTDFIFAVFCEEYGLAGALFLLGLYLLLILRGLYIAYHAQTLFGRLLACGLVTSFFVYVFVNVGMTTGLLPVVGVPLPLLSFGGTSMVTIMAGFGLLMGIQTHRRFLRF